MTTSPRSKDIPTTTYTFINQKTSGHRHFFFFFFVRKARPQGLGLEYVPRGKDAALLLDKTLNDDDAIRMAAGLYALYRTVNHLRFSNTPANFRFTMKLLGKFSRRALEHHASVKLLNFDASLDA